MEIPYFSTLDRFYDEAGEQYCNTIIYSSFLVNGIRISISKEQRCVGRCYLPGAHYEERASSNHDSFGLGTITNKQMKRKKERKHILEGGAQESRTVSHPYHPLVYWLQFL